jgi:hypothetical protein
MGVKPSAQRRLPPPKRKQLLAVAANRKELCAKKDDPALPAGHAWEGRGFPMHFLMPGF